MTHHDKGEGQGRSCVCPYCDVEIVKMKLPHCEGCGVTLRLCAKCEVPVGPDVEVCPECGEAIE